MDTFRARLHGFTGWLNSVLVGKMESNNISISLVEGNCLQLLLESITGGAQKRIQSLDGLTENQKVLRIDWFVEILKKEQIVPNAYRIDSKKFVKKISDAVFPLMSYLVLFHLICIKDVLSKFLRAMNENSMLKHSLNFTSNYINKLSKTSSLTSDPSELADLSIDIVNRILLQDRYTKRNLITDLSQLADSRVLCAMINFFIPGSFTSEILLSDRWTISLCFECATKALRVNFQMEIPDFFSGDDLAISSFVVGMVLIGLKFNQCSIANSRSQKLQILIRDCLSQMEWIEQGDATQALTLKNTYDKLKEQKSAYQEEYDALSKNFDLEKCEQWCSHVKTVQKQIRAKIFDQMKIRFDRILIPGPMTINELCEEYAINLSLTCNIGFYRPITKESLWPDRKLVLYDLKEKVYYDNFTGLLESDDLYKHLGFSTPGKLEELLPSKYEKRFEIFLSSSSKNKKLISNSPFLYQVFPGTRSQCEKLLYRASRNGEKTVVDKLLTFFDNESSFINSKDLNGNTALHHAAKNNHFDVCQLLLENGATVNLCNKFSHSPLYVAAEAIHRDICLLLLEWCANPDLKDRNSKTLYEVLRNGEMKSAIAKKRNAILHVQEMCAKKKVSEISTIFSSNPTFLISNRSRFFAGMTMMHIWAKFNLDTLIETFATMEVDVNLLDFEGKTPLHYTSKKSSAQLLLKWGGNLTIRDHSNNTPLHSLCSTPLTSSETSNDVIDKQACLLYMLEQGLSPLDRTSNGLLPIHCACIAGNEFLIETMLNSETGPEIDEYIRDNTEAPGKVFSPLFYAIIHECHSCIKLLVKKGLLFAPTEATTLLYKLLKFEFPCKDKFNMTHFLLNHGANIWHTFAEYNNTTFLHIISGCEPSPIIDIFLNAGAEVNAIDKLLQTPFIIACKTDNDYAAAKLANKGADIFKYDKFKKTAFDYIPNHEQWIRRGQFSDNIEICNHLRGYSLLKARDMVSQIATTIQLSGYSKP